MAKLFFYYSTMNAGKSTNLLQASYNYNERGFNTLHFNFHADHRNPDGSVETKEKLYIGSRLGLKAEAYPFDNQTNLYEEVKRLMESPLPLKDDNGENRPLGAVLVDESQFLTEAQVRQLSDVVDFLNIPVLCYGIRTDFLGRPFEGSSWLLAWADELVELKTICATGKKATFVLRYDHSAGKPCTGGALVQIGGNADYIPVARRVHKEALASGTLDSTYTFRYDPKKNM